MPRTRLRLPLYLLLLTCFALPPLSGDCYVTLLHFNDFHGYLQPVGKPEANVGGLARMATLVREVRAWNDAHGHDTLFYSAGDILQGTPLSMVFQGEPEVRCLNLMGLQAMCLGNHEFDFGQDNLRRLMALARFPFLSANIYVKETGKHLTSPYILFTLRDGTRAAAFGLTSHDTPVETLPKNVAGLEFTDPIAEAQTLVRELSPRADFLIALSHLNHANDLLLAKACPELDVIVGAHCHTRLDAPVRVGRTLILQAESYGKYLGQLDMFVSGGDVVRYRGFLRTLDQRVPSAPDIEAIVQQYAQQLQVRLREPVGAAAVDLDGERDHVRSAETNLGNLICDMFRDYARAEVCLINAGGIRASLPAGPITVGDILTVVPFGNLIATKQVTGDQLWRTLERAAQVERPSGAFLQVSGLTMVIEGNTLREVQVGGQPLDRNRTYLLVTSEFLLAGGDGYAMLKEGTAPVSLGYADNAVVTQMWRERGTVSPKVEGRIVIK